MFIQDFEKKGNRCRDFLCLPILPQKMLGNIDKTNRDKVC